MHFMPIVFAKKIMIAILLHSACGSKFPISFEPCHQLSVACEQNPNPPSDQIGFKLAYFFAISILSQY